MGELATRHSLGLKAGEWVKVRSVAEILSTLNKTGRLDELPFMPQMLQYCGQKLPVRKRAHKLCDTAYGTGGRRMSSAVFLEGVRCDGQAYGGCEMRCEIFWKEAWLERCDQARTDLPSAAHDLPLDASRRDVSGCSKAELVAATRVPPEKTGTAGPVYVCQATQLIHASQPLPRWVVGQYIEDYTSGNAPMSQILSGLLFVLISNLVESGLGFGSALRWAFDAFQKRRGGFPYPERRGRLQKGGRTPSVKLNLQVGELVRIKEYSEILETVDEAGINRGMGFHPEMVPHCGRTFRVRQRVRKLMNERTGRLMELKNDCLVLEGADCLGRYTKPLNCPRAMPPYWREIWIDRVETKAFGTGEQE